MLRMGGGTISAKTGLLQAGAGQAINMPITVSTTPYMVTTLGYDSDGSTWPAGASDDTLGVCGVCWQERIAFKSLGRSPAPNARFAPQLVDCTQHHESCAAYSKVSTDTEATLRLDLRRTLSTKMVKGMPDATENWHTTMRP